MTKKMSASEKFGVMLAAAISLTLLTPVHAFAMHIMEGYLPLGHSIAWDALALPFVVAGVIGIKRMLGEKPRVLILLAMSGAFVFVISSLKIPSVTGSCSHMTGTGLAAILFGPAITSVLGLIVLLFQAVLLAHGGLTTLGANTASMAIIGPLLTWVLYRVCKKAGVNQKVNIFLAAALGDLLTYIVTSMQLAVAYPSEGGDLMASAVKFLGVFAPTQLPLAIIEGILTVLIVIGMESFAKPELHDLAYMEAK